MRHANAFLHEPIRLLFIAVCLSLLFDIPGYAQQSDDSDPQRWRRVKSWTGTFTYACTDTRLDLQDGSIVTYTWDDHINGSFTLDQPTPQATQYVWNGRGLCSGTIHEVTVVTDESGSSCTNTEDGTRATPLVESPGYSLKINFADGTFFFQAETVQWPVKIENCCEGDCTTTDFTYGNGGINSFFQPLPATGYALKGSYDAALLIGAGTLTATITWDIQAKEIAPASTCPLANTISNQDYLDTFRSLRDGVMTGEAGLLVTMLYYQHAPEVAAILTQHPRLQKDLRELAARHIGVLERLLSDGGAAVPDAVIKDVVCFLEDLKAYASPELQDGIDLALDKISDGSFGKELGITL